MIDPSVCSSNIRLASLNSRIYITESSLHHESTRRGCIPNQTLLCKGRHQSLDIRATKMQLLPSTISQFLFLPTFDHDSFVSPSFLSILFLQFSLAKEIIRGGKVLFRFFFFKRRFRTNEVILIERKLRRFSREFSIRGCVECFGIVICTGKNILSLLLSSK